MDDLLAVYRWCTFYLYWGGQREWRYAGNGLLYGCPPQVVAVIMIMAKKNFQYFGRSFFRQLVGWLMTTLPSNSSLFSVQTPIVLHIHSYLDIPPTLNFLLLLLKHNQNISVRHLSTTPKYYLLAVLPAIDGSHGTISTLHLLWIHSILWEWKWTVSFGPPALFDRKPP